MTARNFYSTLAYQGYGEGVDLEKIEDTTRRFTDDDYMNPDLAIILGLDDTHERVRRISGRGDLAVPDTFESKDGTFQQAVNDGYLQVAKMYDLPILSAAGTPAEVGEQIWIRVQALLAANRSA